MGKTPKIAVIGAGLAGVTLARKLSGTAQVVVFDKSRGLGGRMSTRRADPFQFDHGAQYFTIHSDAFRDFLKPYLNNGSVREWSHRLVEIDQGNITDLVCANPRYVAVPGMTALCKSLAENLDVRRGTRIATVVADDQGNWTLKCLDGETFGPFDWVISTAPSVQTFELLPELSIAGTADAPVVMKGCYSLMIGFENDVSRPWDAAVVKNSPLAWISKDNSKPDRPNAVSFLCQSDNDWAETHMEDDQHGVKQDLLNAFANVTGIAPSDVTYTSLHRWRYAKVTSPAHGLFAIDKDRRFAAAGDWFGKGRVESAFESADALATSMTETIFA